jgi:hypothetical protein
MYGMTPCTTILLLLEIDKLGLYKMTTYMPLLFTHMQSRVEQLRAGFEPITVY